MATETQENSTEMPRTVASTAGVLFCHFIALIVLIGVLLGPVSHFIEFCRACNLMLPTVSQIAVNSSMWMRANWYLPLLGLMPDGIVYFLLARRKPRLNWCAAIWAFVPLVFTIVLLGLLTAGVCAPLQATAKAMEKIDVEMGQHQSAFPISDP